MLITNNLPKKDIFGRYKNLLIIGGGVLQHPTLVECQKLGLGKIVVDGNPDCYCFKSYLLKKDFFIHADIKDPKLVLSQVKKWLKKHRVKIVGVYTQGCDCAYTVAYVADKLGLPNIGVEVARKCNNKREMWWAFHKAGILQPNLIFDFLHYPAVVKPTDNCASRGLTIINDISELLNAIKIAKDNSFEKKFIVQEFINGNEYSVDTIIYKGKVYPAGISDRIFLGKENYAIQNGSLTPSLLSSETQKTMYWIIQDCADALGVKWGALKGDLIIDKEGKIYVLEVTARLSGGFDAQYRKPLSFGVNLIKATIDLAVGNKLNFSDIIPKWFKYSQTFSIFPQPGILKEIKGEKELRNIPGIEKVFITKHIGELIEYKTCADRVIHIIACANTYNELQETIQKARETIQFITE